MAGDTDDQMAHFRRVYFDECAELLEALDSEATSLEPGETDAEKLNAIFRAVHSIKAGAGAFKFARLVSFSHIFESALDLVRNGVITLTPERISLIVKCSDILSDLVGAAQQGVELDGGVEEKASDELRALVDGAGGGAAETSETPVEAAPAILRTWRIKFQPNADLFQFGNEPLLILRELASLGEATIEADLTRLPELSKLDPEECRLAWSISLETDRPRTDISEVFEFVADDAVIEIEAADETPPSSAVAAPSSVQPAGDAPTRATSSSIRVDLDRIDRLVNMVGELVIAQSMAVQAIAETNGGGAIKGLEDLSLRTRELQEGVMAIRMQPVKSVFSRMPRVVRDVSTAIGKKVDLVMVGEATEIDKTVIEELSDPLTHMIRNSLDHGLETPEERRAAGKPESGVITLSAAHRCGRIDISVSDDGRGLNLDRVRQRAVERGLISPDTELGDSEAAQLIFAPGFSTAEAVSELSGRGVGMDVVRRNIQNLGGRVSIETWPGKGSRFTLTLPLTLAVLDGMLIAVGGERYILPVASILETIRPQKRDLRRLDDGRLVLHVRGEITPVVHVGQLLGVDAAVQSAEDALIILSEAETGRRVGLVVDELIGQQQVVVKNLEEHYQAVRGVSGATILGDGRVALILDVDGLSSLEPLMGPVGLSAAA